MWCFLLARKTDAESLSVWRGDESIEPPRGRLLFHFPTDLRAYPARPIGFLSCIRLNSNADLCPGKIFIKSPFKFGQEVEIDFCLQYYLFNLVFHTGYENFSHRPSPAQSVSKTVITFFHGFSQVRLEEKSHLFLMRLFFRTCFPESVWKVDYSVQYRWWYCTSS